MLSRARHQFVNRLGIDDASIRIGRKLLEFIGESGESGTDQINQQLQRLPFDLAPELLEMIFGPSHRVSFFEHIKRHHNTTLRKRSRKLASLVRSRGLKYHRGSGRRIAQVLK